MTAKDQIDIVATVIQAVSVPATAFFAVKGLHAWRVLGRDP
jgi:hypothetical protein